MADREKVIKGLTVCLTGRVGCDGCPYDKECYASPAAIKDGLLSDALELLKEQEHKDRMFHALEDDWKRLKELLKEQEPIKPKRKVRHGETCQYQHWCGNCMVMLHGKPKFCPNCGRKVKWE